MNGEPHADELYLHESGALTSGVQQEDNTVRTRSGLLRPFDTWATDRSVITVEVEVGKTKKE